MQPKVKHNTVLGQCLMMSFAENRQPPGQTLYLLLCRSSTKPDDAIMLRKHIFEVTMSDECSFQQFNRLATGLFEWSTDDVHFFRPFAARQGGYTLNTINPKMHAPEGVQRWYDRALALLKFVSIRFDPL